MTCGSCGAGTLKDEVVPAQHFLGINIASCRVRPPALVPTGTLTVELSGHLLALPLCRPRFTAAAATDGVHTWGGKALLQVDGRAQFAEVAILRLFEEAGWEGRWIETYGKRKLMPSYWRAWLPQGPHAQVEVPIEEPWVNEKLHAIAAANGHTFSGCWDVVAWKEGRLLFAEAKLTRKERFRSTQLRWMEAGLKCGMKDEDFLVVEWSIA